MKITIDIDEVTDVAVEEYRDPRGLSKQEAVKRLTTIGLIRSGELTPTAIHKDLGMVDQ